MRPQNWVTITSTLHNEKQCSPKVNVGRHIRFSLLLTKSQIPLLYPVTGGAVAQRVRHLGLRSVGRGFKSCSRQRCVTTFGKLFTPMCLCHLVPAKGRWCSAAGEVTAGLAESNGSLPPGGWLTVTCRLTACTPGSAPGPTLGVEYGKPLPFLCIYQCHKHNYSCTNKYMQRVGSASFHSQRSFSLLLTDIQPLIGRSSHFTAFPAVFHVDWNIYVYL